MAMAVTKTSVWRVLVGRGRVVDKSAWLHDVNLLLHLHFYSLDSIV